MDASDFEGLIAMAITWGVRLISAIAILIAGWVIGNWVSKRIHKIEALDDTLDDFLGGFAKYAIFIVSGLMVLNQFGFQTASLLAVLGAAGLAIGLALQGTLSNVAAGVMMLVLRPFNSGDYVEVAGKIGGTVKQLGLFSTELSTADNVYIAVPNSKIWGSEIYNYSRNTTRRLDLDFGISYNDDINEAFKIVKSSLDQDDRILTSKGKEPQVMVNGLGDSSVNVTARFWVNKGDYWSTKFDLTKEIKEKLDEGGIDIPFPTRTLIQTAAPAANQDKKPSASGKKKAA